MKRYAGNEWHVERYEYDRVKGLHWRSVLGPVLTRSAAKSFFDAVTKLRGGL
jgi:hypothetical protein